MAMVLSHFLQLKALSYYQACEGLKTMNTQNSSDTRQSPRLQEINLFVIRNLFFSFFRLSVRDPGGNRWHTQIRLFPEGLLDRLSTEM